MGIVDSWTGLISKLFDLGSIGGYLLGAIVAVGGPLIILILVAIVMAILGAAVRGLKESGLPPEEREARRAERRAQAKASREKRDTERAERFERMKVPVIGEDGVVWAATGNNGYYTDVVAVVFKDRIEFRKASGAPKKIKITDVTSCAVDDYTVKTSTRDGRTHEILFSKSKGDAAAMAAKVSALLA